MVADVLEGAGFEVLYLGQMSRPVRCKRSSRSICRPSLD